MLEKITNVNHKQLYISAKGVMYLVKITFPDVQQVSSHCFLRFFFHAFHCVQSITEEAEWLVLGQFGQAFFNAIH